MFNSSVKPDRFISYLYVALLYITYNLRHLMKKQFLLVKSSYSLDMHMHVNSFEQ